MMTRKDVFKDFIIQLSKLSKCKERGVAAIITDRSFSQIYSIGLNGGAKGSADCLCGIEGKYGCLHAEINALIKCTNTDNRKVMFVTLAPCKQCAAAIVNAPGSFEIVYYIEDWKDDTGIKLLKQAGILVVRL
jgi:deoxycytidylate deaminase